MHECHKCGYEMDARPNFCPSCGVSITYTSTGDLDPIIGRTIDDTYKVIEAVGEGAMGRVYRAEHMQLKKQVALKILRSNLISDTTVVKRFERRHRLRVDSTIRIAFQCLATVAMTMGRFYGWLRSSFKGEI